MATGWSNSRIRRGGLGADVKHAVIGLAAVLAASPAAAAGPALPHAIYTMRAGDTLYTLSRSYLRPGAMDVVRRLNRIDNPRRIPIGRHIAIPRALLVTDPAFARIETLTGEVTLGSGAAPRAGMTLGQGALLRTGRGGFVTLRLADGSTVTLPSQSTVRIAHLRRVRLTEAVERSFVAERGRMRVQATPMTDPGSSFEVRTPLTVSAVRGTVFRASFAPDATVAGPGRATTEVEEGKVAVARTGTLTRTGSVPVLVQPGFGTSADGLASLAAVPLLAAPRLAEPDKVQSGETLSFAVEPLPGAAAYRIQVARDAGLLDLVAETDGADATLALPGLPTGTYFARITALSEDGLEGMPRTYSFDRVLNAVAGTMAASGRGFERRYQFKWSASAAATPQFRFQLARKDDPAHPLVDEPVGTATAVTVTSLPAGEYAWRVLSLVPHGARIIPAWSAEQVFEVTARK